MMKLVIETDQTNETLHENTETKRENHVFLAELVTDVMSHCCGVLNIKAHILWSNTSYSNIHRIDENLGTRFSLLNITGRRN